MIRKAKINDINKIVSLGKLINNNYELLYDIPAILKDNYSSIYVYEEKDILGFIHVENHFDFTDLINIVVDEKHRNLKIGTKLLKYIIENNQTKRILLEVRESNFIARHLYEKYGFKEINKRKKYYENEDAVIMERKDIYILGIESSCDETSMSIVKNGCEEIATTVFTQMNVFASYGGVVPEMASRMHTECITLVLDDLLKKANMQVSDVDAIAVTYAPGLLGSLLVGVEAAKVLSFVFNKPLIKTHHIAGHIYANNLVSKIEFPSLALVVSGGHTELVSMEDDYKFNVLGSTLDDAAGECFDKVARVLGLSYPGGPNVEKYAKDGKYTYKLPIPMDNDELNFSFSGLKSSVINLCHNEEQRGNTIRKEDMARSFTEVAIDELVRKTRLAIEKYSFKNLIVAGGVSANSFLREELSKMCNELGVSLSIPPIKYCTDNAAMIAAAAYPQYLKNDFADLSLVAKSQEYFFKDSVN